MRLSNFDVSSNQIKEDDVIRQTNFHRHNPYAVVSPIYVYRQNAEATNKMNSIRGKAVIFVTRDLTLKGHPELLINRWIEEKKSNSPIHTVRMLRLDNAGVTLTDLCNSYYHDVFTTKATTGGEVDTLPFDNDIMGERMLIALHNFRANITRFNNYLESHPINNFESEDIDRVLNEMYKYHQDNQNLTDTEILNNFTGKDQQIAQQILNFNDQCDKQQLRQFRLGGNKANGNAWLIRKTFVTLGKDNKYYNNDDARLANRKQKGEEFENSVNAIYLTTAAAQKFQKVIEEVCDAILDPFEIEIFDNIKGRVVTEDEFVPITSKIYTALRSEVNGRIPYEIRYTENINRAVKYIPRSIIKLASRAIAYSKTEIDSNTDLRYLPAKDNLEQRDWSWDSADKLYYSITDLQDPDGPKIKKELSFRNLIENYGEDLVKILDLCFHGTSNTKGLVDAKLYGKQQKKGDQTYWSQVEPQSTDALFKNGFYIDPMASVNGFDPGIRIEGYG